MGLLQLCELDDSDFEYFSDTIRRRIGLHLTAQKKDLIRSRLAPHLLKHGFQSTSEYKSFLSGLPEGHEEWQELINLLTTNKTDFFREQDHFDFLTQEFLPRWEKSSSGAPLRVWSAACSTGEEPYTLSIVLNHYFKKPGAFKILATDVDTQALAVAKNGVYQASRLEQIPELYRKTSTVKGTGDIASWGKISNAIRQSIQFEQVNLIQTPYSWPNSWPDSRPDSRKEQFDIIFCRNVFIYFKPETISRDCHRDACLRVRFFLPFHWTHGITSGNSQSLELSEAFRLFKSTRRQTPRTVK